MDKINYEKLRKEFTSLPKDYAKLVQQKYPNIAKQHKKNINLLK